MTPGLLELDHDGLDRDAMDSMVIEDEIIGDIYAAILGAGLNEKKEEHRTDMRHKRRRAI